MELIAVFTIVQVLGGTVPGVIVMPGDFTTVQDCMARVADMNSRPTPPGFTDKGVPILMETYTCQYFTSDQLAKEGKSLAN